MNLKEKDAWRLLRQCFHFSIKEEFLWFVTGIIENFQLGEWSVGSLTPSKALCDPIRWLKVGLSKPNKACELRCFAWGKPLALILNPWKNNLHAVYWSIVLTWNSFRRICRMGDGSEFWADSKWVGDQTQASLKVKVLVTQVVSDSATPWIVTHQAPVSMEFSRQ